MEKAGVRKDRGAGASSIAAAMWDPFWLMRQMFGWGRSAETPSFEVKETNEGYVCKVNVKLALPDQADAAHVKAELEDGQLTLLVPKAAASTPEPAPAPEPVLSRADASTGSACASPSRMTSPRTPSSEAAYRSPPVRSAERSRPWRR
jgi:hypothetical protein